MKEKWYLTTGRENEEASLFATKVMFGGSEVFVNRGSWVWLDEEVRTEQRLGLLKSCDGTLVAYTLGEKVEGNKKTGQPIKNNKTREQERLDRLKLITDDETITLSKVKLCLKEIYSEAWEYLNLDGKKYMDSNPEMYFALCAAYEQIKNTKGETPC